MKLLLLFLLISCGSNNSTRNTNQFIPLNDSTFKRYKVFFIHELRNYANEYEMSLVEDKIMNFPIAYYDKDIIYSGACYKGSHIEIYKENILWGEAGIRMVVFHELSHCVLNLPHYDEEEDLMNSKDGLPIFNDNYILRWLDNIRQ